MKRLETNHNSFSILMVCCLSFWIIVTEFFRFWRNKSGLWNHHALCLCCTSGFERVNRVFAKIVRTVVILAIKRTSYVFVFRVGTTWSKDSYTPSWRWQGRLYLYFTFGNQPELIPQWLLCSISNIQHFRQGKVSYWLTVSIFRSSYLHFPNKCSSPYFQEAL